MSRSYKKNHIVKDHNSGEKNYANRRVRHVPIELTDTLQGGGYTRHYESWDICDYAFDGDYCEPEEIYDENGKYTRWWRSCFYNK